MLERILSRADGIDGSNGKYAVAKGHQLTFYIGQPGQAMTVAEVERTELGDGIISLMKKDAIMYLGVDAVHAIAVRKIQGEDDRRTGFL